MKPSKLNELKKEYLKIKEDLEKSIANADTEIDISGDEVDEIQGKNLARIQMQLSNKQVQKLRLIESSIDKMSDPDFGSCEECGDDIGFKRLRASPGAIMCIKCAERAEKFTM